MSPLHRLPNIAHVARIFSLAQDLGMRLEIGTDFSAYRNIRTTQENRPIYPMFDINGSYVDASTAFWIVGKTSDGQLAHTQAVRMVHLINTSLGDHLREHNQKYLHPGLVDDPSAVTYEAPIALSQVTGNVCYHGEFWLKDGADGFRRQGFTSLMCRLAFELVQTVWSPDYMFGLVSSTLAHKGILARYGYFHGTPGTWSTENDDVVLREHIVWMDAADLQALTRRSLEEIDLSPVPARQTSTPPAKRKADKIKVS